MRALGRAARASRLYAADNATLQRMIVEVNEALTQVLGAADELTIKVRPDAFMFEDERVLYEPDPDDSIPFAFFRDGIRRLVLYRGLRSKELELLLTAIAGGLSYSGTGLGDDIVSHLWRHDLEHVTYVGVETTVVDAETNEVAKDSDAGEYDVDAQIDGLLYEIYGGSTDDAGPRSLHLDETDLPAKNIADAIEARDSGDEGLHPARRLRDPAVYVRTIHEELELDDDRSIAKRATDAALDALGTKISAGELNDLLNGLLNLFDAAVLDENTALARRIVDGVRRRREERATERWLREICAEARLRSLVAVTRGATDPELLATIEAVGSQSVPTLAGMLPGFAERSERRVVADLIVHAGVDDVSVFEALIDTEQPFVVLDVVEILARTESIAAAELLVKAGKHENASVRTAVLERVTALSLDQGHELASKLMRDSDPTVRAAAARALATSANRELHDPGEELIRRMRAKDACALIETAVDGLEDGDLPLEVKIAFVEAYARLHQLRAYDRLAKLVKRGEGLLAKKRHEDMAVAALHAMATQPTPRARELLAKTAKGRQRRLRETARELMEAMS